MATKAIMISEGTYKKTLVGKKMVLKSYYHLEYLTDPLMYVGSVSSDNAYNVVGQLQGDYIIDDGDGKLVRVAGGVFGGVIRALCSTITNALDHFRNEVVA